MILRLACSRVLFSMQRGPRYTLFNQFKDEKARRLMNSYTHSYLMAHDDLEKVQILQAKIKQMENLQSPEFGPYSIESIANRVELAQYFLHGVSVDQTFIQLLLEEDVLDKVPPAIPTESEPPGFDDFARKKCKETILRLKINLYGQKASEAQFKEWQKELERLYGESMFYRMQNIAHFPGVNAAEIQLNHALSLAALYEDRANFYTNRGEIGRAGEALEQSIEHQTQALAIAQRSELKSENSEVAKKQICMSVALKFRLLATYAQNEQLPVHEIIEFYEKALEIIECYQGKSSSEYFQALHEKLVAFGQVEPIKACQEIDQYLSETSEQLEDGFKLTLYLLKFSFHSMLGGEANLQAAQEIEKLRKHVKPFNEEMYSSYFTIMGFQSYKNKEWHECLRYAREFVDFASNNQAEMNEMKVSSLLTIGQLALMAQVGSSKKREFFLCLLKILEDHLQLIRGTNIEPKAWLLIIYAKIINRTELNLSEELIKDQLNDFLERFAHQYDTEFQIKVNLIGQILSVEGLKELSVKFLQQATELKMSEKQQ